MWTACWPGLLAIATASWASDVETCVGQAGWTLLCPVARTHVRVDGRLAEWDMTKAPVVLDRAHLGVELREDPPTGTDVDLSARVALTWKGSKLFVGASVTDDEVTGLAPRKQWGHPWEHDSLMMFLLPTGGGVLAGRLAQTPAAPYPSRGIFGLSFHGSGERPRPIAGLTYAARRTPNGYDVEGAIDFSAYGWAVRPGDVFRFALIVADRDPGQSGPSGFGQWVWRLGDRFRGETSDRWGLLRLLDDRGTGLDLYCSDPEPLASEPLEVGGTADAVRSGVALARLELCDPQGKVVAERSVNVPLVAGKRTRFRTTLAAAGAPGRHMLRAVTTVGGKHRNGPSVPILIRSKRARPTAVLPPGRSGQYYTDDPARYRLPHLLIRERQVTRQDYLARAKANMEGVMGYNPHQFKRAWRWAHTYGVAAAVLYKATGQKRYADYAKAAWDSSLRWSRKGTAFHFMYVHMIKIMADVMRETGVFTEQDDPEIREHIVNWAHKACWGCYGWKANPWRRGAGHSSLGPAVARGLAALYYPDVTDAAFWKKYCEATFNDSWRFRDNIYNDTNYQPLWFFHMTMYGHLGKRPEVFTDREIRKVWDRYLYYMHPMGAHPSIGDGQGWNQEFHKYVLLFEMLARYTKDGRYKWAAHRLFQYAEDRIDGWATNHIVHHHSAFFYALAWLLADDSVAVKEPDPASRVLMRKELIHAAREKLDPGHQIYQYKPGAGEIADKVMLTSGHDRDGLWAMVECCPHAGHNQPGDTTAILSLVDKTSVLLASPVGRNPANHNRLQVEDLTGLAPPRQTETTTVPTFVNGKSATGAVIRVTGYDHLPVTVERRILFVKQRMMLVRDTATFEVPFLVRMGPAFNHQNVGPQCGETWTNSYVNSLWAYRGTQRWRNPVRDVLVYHAPRPDTRLRVTDFARDGALLTNPLRVRYTWQGLPTTGRVEEFTTLVLPHKPVRDVAKWVRDHVSLVLNTPGQTAFRVTSRPPREWEELVVMNRGGRTLQAGDLKTDAHMLFLAARRGQCKHLFATDASFVEWKGKTLTQSAKRRGLTER